MAFLDNSGDIILDAVLTDTGRFRMARGDFRISKFALGDDEIDYSLYNKTHPSGSAYYDLEVLRTPVLEAFTNNSSTMKSKLISISATNILHMPILKLLNGGNTNWANRPDVYKRSKLNASTGGYIVTVDQSTQNENNIDAEVSLKGIIKGATDNNIRSLEEFTETSIIIERGLDTTKIAPGIGMDSFLRESQFIIEIDHRLGSIVTGTGEQIPVSFIDDDQIASYYVSMNVSNGANTQVVYGSGGGQITVDNRTLTANAEGDNPSVHNIRGPRDVLVRFKVDPSLNLKTSTFLFDKLGSSLTTTVASANLEGFKPSRTFKFIDSIVRVTSVTTAYSIDIPVRFVKATSDT